jgi:hypothetical protein
LLKIDMHFSVQIPMPLKRIHRRESSFI